MVMVNVKRMVPANAPMDSTEIPVHVYLTMIGNGKFEPLVWNDIELRYRITASQWTS